MSSFVPNFYPGKKKLILCGFHEAALAAFVGGPDRGVAGTGEKTADDKLDGNDPALQRYRDVGVREVEVRVKGPGSGRESAITALQSAGMTVKLIEDCTPIPHNGVRLKKRRRI